MEAMIRVTLTQEQYEKMMELCKYTSDLKEEKERHGLRLSAMYSKKEVKLSEAMACGQCMKVKPIRKDAAFFTERKPHFINDDQLITKQFYCGCRGWD